MNSWRALSAQAIAKVLDEHKGSDEKTIKKALFDAYPFGQRRYHPYKIWLDEIRRQRGLKTGVPGKAESQKLREWNELYGKGESQVNEL